jgi:GMP synthase-like glutamine amidotransferase
MAKFAVLHCYPPGIWDHGSQLWVDALAEEGEDWVVLRAESECPRALDAATFRGVVITGSPAAVYDAAPWMTKLADFLRACYVPSGEAPAGRPRVIGGCFGAQLIGQALGGTVEAQGFDVLRTELLVTTPAFKTLGWKRGPLPPAFRLIESHGDCVRTLPPDSVLLASSSSCVNEFFSVGANMVALQAHPEFRLKEEVHGNLWPRLLARQREEAAAGTGAEEEALSEENDAAFATFGMPLDDLAMLALLRAFIKG